MLDHEAILGGLDVGVIVQDTKSAIVYANACARRMLGFDEGDLVGRSSFDPGWDCIAPDGSPMPPARRPIALTLATREPVRGFVMGIARPKAERSWLAVSTEPCFDANGAISLINVTLRDVSHERNARMNAERALEESERLYHSVLRAMSEGVVVHDHDGAIRFANPAAERVLGLTFEQMAGRTSLDPSWRLVDEHEAPFDPANIPSEVTRLTGMPCNQVPIGLRRANGERAWLSVSTDPVAFDATTGRPSAVVATFADVTHEELARAELARSRAQFQKVTDAFPGVLYDLRSRDGRYRFAFLSGRAEEFFGVTDTQALSDASSVISRIHPDEVNAVLRSLEISERTMAPWQSEFRLPAPSGSFRWCRALAVPEKIANETVWHGVILDVTEEHRLADSVRHQQRVDAMGGLAAGVAHNFNNMLAVIQPNLEMALEGAHGELREMLENARLATGGAAELVKQLMRLTRRETESAFESVNLGGVVADVVTLLERTVDRAIRLRVDVPSDAITVHGRASDLHQVILNLCINARDALVGCAHPQITISLSFSKGPLTTELQAGTDLNQHVVLSVSDNGMGMDEETRKRIGEPFFTTKGPGRGTGLGLASVFRIVREMSGLWEVESQLGHGARFTIRLPLVQPLVPAAPAPSSVDLRLDGLRLLVVEDERLVRSTLVRQLERLGAKVSEAVDGPSALEIFVKGKFDLVLLDLNMPVMPGEQVLAEMRSRAPEQPIVILTGYVEDPSRLASANAVISKPIARDSLIETIEGVLATVNQPSHEAMLPGLRKPDWA